MKEPDFPEVPGPECKDRIAKAKDLMKRRRLDLLLLFCPENIYYYTGFRKAWTFQWLHACIFPLDGDPVLIVPQISHRVAEHTSWAGEVRPHGGASHWGAPNDPVKLIKKTVMEFGPARKRIGLELNGPAMQPWIFPSTFEAVKSNLKGSKFLNVTDMIWQQRIIKTHWEIETFKKLCDIGMKGFKAALEFVKEGVTERQVLAEMWKTFISEGAVDSPMQGDMMFRGGAKHYYVSTPRPVDRKLVKGRIMYFDGGPSYKGYYLDFQRMLSIGEPSRLQMRLFDISAKAQSTAAEAFKPGNKVSDVHKAAMTVIDEVPNDLRAEGVQNLYSHVFMGHGEGLCIHEPPWITADEDTVLKPGMTLSLEVPALDIPQFRVQGGFPEDVYLITEHGHDNLTGAIPSDLWVVKA